MTGANGVLGTITEIALERRDEGRGPTRIAVDGRDGAGKTTFADRLAAELAARNVETYRSSIDDWQRPSEDRYRQGRFSPEGYYLDGFDHLSLRRKLLEPFATGKPGRLAAFDVETDKHVAGASVVASVQSVLIVDGVFLLRTDLRDCWELSIYLAVDAATALERGIARDTLRSGEAQLERRLYLERYGPGQDLYDLEITPTERAVLPT